MKKLILLFACLFFVAFSFAQNVATETINGNNNDNDVVQTGTNQTTTVTVNGDRNDSYVNQFTDNSGAQTTDVIQTGNNNNAYVDMDQIGVGDIYTNTSYINQIGDWNNSYQKIYSPGYNSGNNVYGKQDGSHNDLSQRILRGYSNNFRAISTGDYNEVVQLIPQGTKNTGFVCQDGNRNKANQYLFGSNNGYLSGGITIDQDGDYNEAVQSIKSILPWSDYTNNNDADIKQEGNSNYSLQNVDGWKNDVDATMYGDRNKTRQYVLGESNTSMTLIDGSSNDVKTNQNGILNGASIKLNDSYNGDASNNIVDVYQKGDFNYLQLGIRRGDIGGDWNDVNVDHNGNGHYNRLKIDGSHNDIDINSKGNVGGSQYNGNRGDWNITDGDPVWTETSSYNKLYLYQDGFKNYATGKVAGDRNDIDIRQVGDHNLVGTDWHTTDGVKINGDYNTVDVRQTGSGLMVNSGFINIIGNGNTPSIIQNN